MPDPQATRDLSSTWNVATTFAGWLTDAQARMLWDCAVGLPPGAQVVEIGSHQARSTAVLAAALAGRSGRLTAIDPHQTGFGPGHEPARHGFDRNLERLGLRDQVHHLPELSHRVLPGWTAPVDLLYVDGAHDYVSVVRDLRWVRHVRDGGVVLVHDAFSSLGVTAAFLTHVLPGSRLVYVDRAGSLVRFRVGRPGGRDRVRLLRQLPYFARNLAIKAAMYTRSDRLARALGHTQLPDKPF